MFRFHFPLATLLLIISIVAFSQEKINSGKLFNFMPLPIIMSNPTFGPSFGGMGALMYKIDRADTLSPMSKTSFMGMYGLNKSYSWWLSQEAYFKNDNYRLIVNIGSFEIPVVYNYKENQQLQYSENNYFVRAKFMKKITSNLFGGLYYNFTPQQFSNVNNKTKDQDLVIANNTQSSLGLLAVYDSRDYIYYPRNGVFSNIYAIYNTKSNDGNGNFICLNYNFMKYLPLFKKDVLAFRLNGVNMIGDVTYGALALYGVSSVDLSQVDLRGYMRGKYRGKNQADVQVEYRHNFSKKLDRWGIVFNAGTGRVWQSNYQSGLYNSNQWLPAVGAGIRYTAIKKRHLNIRLDYGYGIMENHAIYLGLYEAF